MSVGDFGRNEVLRTDDDPAERCDADLMDRVAVRDVYGIQAAAAQGRVHAGHGRASPRCRGPRSRCFGRRPARCAAARHGLGGTVESRNESELGGPARVLTGGALGPPDATIETSSSATLTQSQPGPGSARCRRRSRGGPAWHKRQDQPASPTITASNGAITGYIAQKSARRRSGGLANTAPTETAGRPCSGRNAEVPCDQAGTELAMKGSIPASTKAMRSRASPERIRLLTVPAGTPSSDATST